MVGDRSVIDYRIDLLALVDGSTMKICGAGAYIGGEYDYCLGKINCLAAAVGEPAFIKDL